MIRIMFYILYNICIFCHSLHRFDRTFDIFYLWFSCSFCIYSIFTMSYYEVLFLIIIIVFSRKHLWVFFNSLLAETHFLMSARYSSLILDDLWLLRHFRAEYSQATFCRLVARESVPCFADKLNYLQDFISFDSLPGETFTDNMQRSIA